MRLVLPETTLQFQGSNTEGRGIVVARLFGSHCIILRVNLMKSRLPSLERNGTKASKLKSADGVR